MSLELGISHVSDGRITVPHYRGGDIELTHDNAWLQVYGSGEGQYDHGVFTDEDGTDIGFVPDSGLKTALAEYDYPIKYLDQLDALGFKFFAAFQKAKLEASRENH